MIIDDCFLLGHIVKKHGLKGELSILLDVDYPEDYKDLESVFVEVNKQLIPFFMEYLQLNGNRGIVKFEEVDDLPAAERLLKCNLYLPLTNLPKLPEGQFYYHEIIQYQVMDKAYGDVGHVEQVYEFPHQDLLAVIHKDKEILIPINDETIVSVNHEQQHVHVDLPEGLLEIYLQD